MQNTIENFGMDATDLQIYFIHTNLYSA